MVREGEKRREVARILGISTSIIMFHYRQVAQQCGTTNWTPH